MDRLDSLLLGAADAGLPMRLAYKRRSRVMRAIAWWITPLIPDFLDGTATVVGGTVFLPGAPGALSRPMIARVVAHEWVHRRDARRWGPLFYLSYVALFPVFRTARAYWERRAYAVEMMLAYEDGGAARLDAVTDELVRLFSGPAYLWMWAGAPSARVFLAPVREEIRAGTLQHREPYPQILAAWRRIG